MRGVRAISLLGVVAVAVAAATGVLLHGRGGAPEVVAAQTSSDCRRGASSQAPATSRTAARRLLAMWWNDSATARGTLAEVDPRTLAPGRRLTPGPFGSSWAFSPTGRQLALGGATGAVRFIDLASMRKLDDFRPGARGYVGALAWPTDNRLLALEQWEGEVVRGSWLLVVDPSRRRLLERRPLNGGIDEVEEGNGKLVAVLAPRSRIGPARLVVAEPTGQFRCVVLRGISTGRERLRNEGVVHTRKPGLALDLAGDRAFVVSAGEPIAEVDLRDLRVSYHSLAARASLLERVRDWLEPEALAKVPFTGSRRQALWLDHGLLAVSGFEQDAAPDGYSESPAGLRLVDTRTWSMRVVDDHVSRIVRADDALIAFDALEEAGTRHGYGNDRYGVSVYGLDGRLRFRLFEGRKVEDVQAAGSYAYVSIKRRIAIVDVRSGEVIAAAVRPRGEFLIGDERPWF